MSLCMVSPVLFCKRSSCRPLALSSRSVGVNQGAEREKETGRVFSGAWESRRVRRLLL